MTNDEIKNKIKVYVPAAIIKTQEDEVIEYMNAKFPGTKVSLISQFVNFSIETEVSWLDLRALMTSLDGKELNVSSPCADCGQKFYSYRVTL